MKKLLMLLPALFLGLLLTGCGEPETTDPVSDSSESASGEATTDMGEGTDSPAGEMPAAANGTTEGDAAPDAPPAEPEDKLPLPPGDEPAAEEKPLPPAEKPAEGDKPAAEGDKPAEEKKPAAEGDKPAAPPALPETGDDKPAEEKKPASEADKPAEEKKPAVEEKKPAATDDPAEEDEVKE